ncbi:MAG: hypothetical protein IJY74_06245, partial [Oscillospiraceae bacterium]|nr:hypothetical protein [Oscillospiraceae bacterium]
AAGPSLVQAAAHDDLHVVQAALLQESLHILGVAVSPAVIGADQQDIALGLHQGVSELLNRGGIAQVEHVGAGNLQDLLDEMEDESDTSSENTESQESSDQENEEV